MSSTSPSFDGFVAQMSASLAPLLGAEAAALGTCVTQRRTLIDSFCESCVDGVPAVLALVAKGVTEGAPAAATSVEIYLGADSLMAAEGNAAGAAGSSASSISVVLLISRDRRSNNAPGEAPAGTASPAPQKSLSMRDVTLRTISMDSPAESLSRELVHVFGPLCRGNRALSTSIAELASAVKVHSSLLPEFRITRFIHPDVMAAVAAAGGAAAALGSAAGMESIAAALAAKCSNETLNDMLRLRNRCVQEFDINVDPSVTSFLDEGAFWNTVFRWTEDALSQLQSKEWELHNRVLVIKRRVAEIHVSGKLNDLKERVKRYLDFFASIPHAAIGKSNTLEELLTAIQSVFEKLKACTSISYPVARCTMLASTVVSDVVSRFLEMSQAFSLFRTSNDARQWLGVAMEMLKETRRGFHNIEELLTAFGKMRLGGYGGGLGTNAAGSPASQTNADVRRLEFLEQRLGQLKKLLEAHAAFVAGLQHIVSANAMPAASTLAKLETALTEFGSYQRVVLDASDDAHAEFRAGLEQYQRVLAAVDAAVGDVIQKKFSAATSSSEMYRWHKTFQPLNVRPSIRGTLGQFQSQLLQLIDGSIHDAKTAYLNPQAAQESIRFYLSRGVSPTVAQVMWERSVAKRIDELTKRRELVSELGWQRLLLLRRDDRCWELNDALANFIGVALSELETITTMTTKRIRPEVYGTAYALAFLELIHSTDAAEWRDAVAPSQNFLRYEQEFHKEFVLDAAKKRLEAIGVGQRHVTHHQSMIEHQRFNASITAKSDQCVKDWVMSVQAVMWRIAGEIYFADSLSAKGCIFSVYRTEKGAHLIVNFPLEMARMIRDERELSAMGMLSKVDMSQLRPFFSVLEPLAPHAVTLHELLRLYYEKSKVTGDGSGTSGLELLLVQEHNAVQELFIQGASLQWDHSNLVKFIRDFSQAMGQYCHNVDRLKLITSQVAFSIDSMAPSKVDTAGDGTSGPNLNLLSEKELAKLLWALPSSEELKTKMSSVQVLINQIAVMCPANVGRWLPTLQPKLTKHFASHLDHLIGEWTSEFLYMDPNHRTSVQDSYAQHALEGVSAEMVIPGLRQHFGLTHLNVAVKVSHQQVRLEPSLASCRRYWFSKFNEAIGIMVELPPVLRFGGGATASIADGAAASAELSAQRKGFHYLIDHVDAQILNRAYDAIETALTTLQNSLDAWRRHQALWEMELDVVFRNLGTNLDMWTSLVTEIRTKAKSMMDTTETSLITAGFFIDAGEAQSGVAAKFQQMAAAILSRFRDVVGKEATVLYELLLKEREGVEAANVSSSVEDALAFISKLPLLKQNIREWGVTVEKCVAAQALIVDRTSTVRLTDRAGAGVWIDAERLQSEYESLCTLATRKTSKVEERRAALQESVAVMMKNCIETTHRLDTDFRAASTAVNNMAPLAASQEINRLHGEIQKLAQLYLSSKQAQEALGLETTTLIKLESLETDVELLKGVLDAVCQVHTSYETICLQRLVEIYPPKLQESFKALESQLLNFPGSMRSFVTFQTVLKAVQRTMSLMWLISDLRGDAMREDRHWASLRQHFKRSATVTYVGSRNGGPAVQVPPFSYTEARICDVLDTDPASHEGFYKGVILHAQGELALRSFVEGVMACWDDYLLDITMYQGKTYLVRGWDAMFEKLSEHLSALQSMKLSPYFKGEIELSVNATEEKLNRAREVLDVLMDVQRRWIYLEGVFGASADIKQQLPDAAALFERSSREFLALMPKPKANVTLTILRFTSTEKLSAKFDQIGRLLSQVQKTLGDYLEKQRSAFARFYFVGDDDLLDVLGNGKDALLIAKHLRKMFSGIASIQLVDGGSGSRLIKAMSSPEGEVVPLTSAVETMNVKVDEWLGGLEQAMVKTLKSQIHDAVASYPFEAKQAVAWVQRFPNQVVCLATQIYFSQKMDALFAGGADSGCQPVETMMISTLEELARVLGTSGVDGFQRGKIEQLITVFVYQRDVATSLRTCKNKDNFEWASRLRCYEQSVPTVAGSTAPAGATDVIIKMADAEFKHSFEYLGLAERLVQTPLTDKCYLTLTQALHTKLGGSPSGPAGTGKTETVKSLGNQLGRFTLVFNCDESFDFKSMGRILIGLCQVGAWGCFDEFNRLEERILSAVSQQIQCIQEGLRHQSKEIRLGERTNVPVHGNVGIFITMNPGYAGRSNLPDNLKQLFRSVAMASPDREAIAEVTLFAQGFRTAQKLSRKVVPLFRLCKDQLSPQQHYDFGLRALNSVLTSAGALKRAKTASGKTDLSEQEESALVIQSLTETVIPKLVAEDSNLFAALLKDVFPGYEPPHDTLAALRAAIEQRCQASALVPIDSWVLKLMQLYKITHANHGIMLVGPSGTGKTAAWKTLLHAMSVADDVDCHAYVIDPKAVTKADLFGVLDPTTRDWKDGVFTSILRKIIDGQSGSPSDGAGGAAEASEAAPAEASSASVEVVETKRHWIIFDGDVDPEWVENLNSLLDDNKLLTLPNGERLALPPNVRIVFEVTDLKYATLATVSRCGMIWFSDGTLPPSALLQSAWEDLQRRPFTAKEDADSCAFIERQSTRVTRQQQQGNASSGGPEYNPEQKALLAFQRETLKTIAHEFQKGGLVEKALLLARTRLDKSAIMEYDLLQAIRSIMSLLGAGLEQLFTLKESHRIPDPTPEHLSLYVRRRLLFALVWGLSSMCSLQERMAFAEELKLGDGPRAASATAGAGPLSIIDCDVNIENGQWLEWRSKVPASDIPAHKVGTNDMVIATVDTIRHEEILASWLKTGKPVILCGPPGSGKTMSLTAVLRSNPEYECAFLNFSSQTTPLTVIRLLEQYTQYKSTIHGWVLVPRSVGKKLIVFCDEINLPSPDKYGTQAVISLLRQLCERRGFYRAKDNVWVSLEGIMFAGACNPPTDPGRTPLPPRFLRWAPVLFVDFPAPESLIQIYSTYCRAVLKKLPKLRALAPNLATAMVAFYRSSQQHFTPEQQRHYVYSPRELSRWSRAVHEGLVTMEDGAQLAMGVEQLVRLAVHEGLRLFRDRLTTPEEQQWTDSEIDKAFMSAFAGMQSTCLARPILYSTISTRAYASVALDDLRKDIQGKFKTFADEELDVQIVVFDDVVEHVVRLDRVLRQPLGHLLLVGASGVGKTVLARFVAWINGMSPYQVKVHRGYTLQDFEEDLRTVMKRAGCKREKICFIFDESNVLDSGFLEYMNALLASGEVPGLFEGEEWAALIHQIRDSVSAGSSGGGSSGGQASNAAGSSGGSTGGQASGAGSNNSGQDGGNYVDVSNEAELYKWFITQVTLNLHIVFTMNPYSSDFSNRTATSPALFNRCTIDWFGDWSSQTLLHVGKELIRKTDLLSLNPAKFKDFDDAQLRIGTALVRVHDLVSNVNAKVRVQTANQGGTFITPRHYLDFIQQFLSLLKEKQESTYELQRHLNGGLLKLKDTATKVDEQQQKLIEKEKVLAEAQSKAQEMLTQIVLETQKAEKGKKESETLAATLEVEGVNIQTQRKEAEGKLASVQPLVDEAAAALNTIKVEFIREMRAYATPPVMVRKVMEAVCFVLGEKKANDWDVVKGYMRKDDFLQQVRSFKPNAITEEIRQKVKTSYMNDDAFTYDNAMKGSKAAGPLLQWVVAQVKFSEIYNSIKPLQDSIARLAQEHDVKAAALEIAKKDVAVNEASLKRLTESYAAMMEETSKIKSGIALVAQRCQRATRLMTNLASERIRWEEQSSSFKVQMSSVLGDCLVAGAFLAYIGHFDEATRQQQLLFEWKDLISSELKIDLRQELLVTEFLSRPDQRATWLANKLPQDTLCIENAVILSRFKRRYPLVVDPSGQAAEFLELNLKEHKVKKTSFLEKNFMKILEQAVRFGSAIVINDAEHIDPVLNPILNREVRKTGGRMLIRLGPQEIDVGPGFFMVLVTRDANHQFSPDVCGRVTMINFTITPGSMTTQMLHMLLQHERQDIEVKRSELMKLQGEYTLKLRTLEDQLLVAIADSEGHILENEALVATLETLKAEAGMVAEKMRESEVAYNDIRAVEGKYSPLSVVGARMFFALGQLAELNPMYRVSRNFFFDAVMGALAAAAQKLPSAAAAAGGAGAAAALADERLPLITRNIFRLVSTRVSRGMFEVDHAAYLLRLAQLRLDLGDDMAKKCPSELFSQLLSSTGDEAAAGASAGGSSKVPPAIAALIGPSNAEALSALAAKPTCAALAASLSKSEAAWVNMISKSKHPVADFPADALVLSGSANSSLVAQSLLKLLVLRIVRPAALAVAMESFLKLLFDCDVLGKPLPYAEGDSFNQKTHLQDINAVVPELDPFTPLLLINCRGFDATKKAEALAEGLGKNMLVVAMGSPEGLIDANMHLANAMVTGDWVLLKNVHLAGAAFLGSLEKRLYTEKFDGRCHASFRLLLATEVCNTMPHNLIRASRTVTFEPPPGVKSNLMRTLCALNPATALPKSHPSQLPRLLFVAAWCHAVIMERLRYAPLGWSKRYEFSDAEFFRTVTTIVSWTCGGGLSKGGLGLNVPHASLPWDAMTKLVSQTIYGGKIDNPFDACVLDSFVKTLFSPAMFEPTFSLVQATGSGGVKPEPVMCHANALEDFQAWVMKLPDVEPPEWLGLPSTATETVLTTDAIITMQKLAQLQSAVGEDASTDDHRSPGRSTASRTSTASDSGASVAWISRVQPMVARFRAALSALPVLPTLKVEAASDPLALTLDREMTLAHKLVGIVKADLEELQAVMNGSVKPSNVHRLLIECFLRDTIPARWKKYPVISMMSLSAWVVDFASRLENLHTVTSQWAPGLTAAGGLFSLLTLCALSLGKFFFPGAFITASRQAAARKKAVALELLELTVSLKPVNDLTPLNVAVDTMRKDHQDAFLLTGMKLHGAAVGSDGVLGVPAVDAPPGAVVVSMEWNLASELAAKAAAEAEKKKAAGQSVAPQPQQEFPMYLDEQRTEVLTSCSLSVSSIMPQFYQRGVCLTAWNAV